MNGLLGCRVAGVSVAMVAGLMRLLPMLLHGGSRAILENDDGVYVASALRLLSGQMPYRSYVLVQPPGLLYWFGPAAALGRANNDGLAMVLARLTVVLMSALTAYLMWAMIRRRSATIAVAAAGFYAVWQPAVVAGRTALLEPAVTLCTVAAVAALTPSHRRQRASGALMALGCLTKLMCVPLSVVLFIWTWRRHGAAAAVRWGVGLSLSALVLLTPFIATAPGGLWTMTVYDQSHRPSEAGSLWDRLSALSGWYWNPHVMHATTVHGAGLFAGVVLVGGVLAAAFSPSGRIWSAITAVNALTIAISPTFAYHYVEVLVAPLTLCYATAAIDWLPHPRAVATAACSFLAGMTTLSLAAFSSPMLGARLPTSVARALHEARCPWTMSASVAMAADVEDHVCGRPVDYFGVVLHETPHEKQTSVAQRAIASPTVQSILRSAFRRADVAVLTAENQTFWSSDTRRLFRNRFAEKFASDGFSVWEVRPHASAERATLVRTTRGHQ